jgi:hypothetical protein
MSRETKELLFGTAAIVLFAGALVRWPSFWSYIYTHVTTAWQLVKAFFC